MYAIEHAFSLGQIVATRNALDTLPICEIHAALDRHQRGDWGDVSKADGAANDAAVSGEARILSVYKPAGGATFWIITEWDRSATTILLPEDY